MKKKIQNVPEIFENNKKEEAKEKFIKLLKKIENMGIDKLQLTNLIDKQNLFNIKNNKNSFFNFYTILLIIFGSIYVTGLYTAEGFSRTLLFLQNKNVYGEKCVICSPNWFNDILRPPVNCDICENITEIKRIIDINPKQFEENYAYSGVPVVIEDGMKNWTATKIFSFNYFKHLYKNNEEKQIRCQFFPYKTEFRSLHEVFNMSDDRANMENNEKPWYIGWSNCDDKIARELRRHYDRPYFLPDLSENINIDWIFMGSSGYGAHMHVDNVNNPSWQAQLVGSKLWTLQPPLECFYKCKIIEVIVNPGDIFVLDTNMWYHQTSIVSNGISITIGAEYD